MSVAQLRPAGVPLRRRGQGEIEELKDEIKDYGEEPCCSTKEHLAATLFCLRGRLPSPFSNGCDGLRRNYSSYNFLELRRHLYLNVKGLPGMNKALEYLNKDVEKEAVISMCYLLDTTSLAGTEDWELEDWERLADSSFSILEHGVKITRTQRNYSSKNLLVRKKPFHQRLPKFAKLPPEIRRMIWSQTLYGRVVQIYRAKQGLKSTCPIPVALHVCQESRALALKHFNLYKMSHEPARMIGKALFHFEHDTLYLSNRSHAFEGNVAVLRSIMENYPAALKKLRFIAVYMDHHSAKNNVTPAQRTILLNELGHFEALEEVIIIYEDKVISFDLYETELENLDKKDEVRVLKKVGTTEEWYATCTADNPMAGAPTFTSKVPKSYGMNQEDQGDQEDVQMEE